MLGLVHARRSQLILTCIAGESWSFWNEVITVILGFGLRVNLAEALLRGAASNTCKLMRKKFTVYKPSSQIGNEISFVYPRYIITSCPFSFFFNK
jgi:hypothetical protein